MPFVTREKFVFLLARYGAFSIGLIYISIGVAAMLSLLKVKKGGADEDSVLDFMAISGFGKALVVLLLLGMLSYIGWRIYEAITDPYDFGNSFGALFKRAGIGLGALAYFIIVISAVEALFGVDPNLQGTPDQQRLLVARMFTKKGGEWLVGLMGVITAVAGIVEFRYMASKEYKIRFKMERLSGKQKKFIRVLAWCGHLARAVILCIIGYFLLQSAFQSDPGM